MLHSKDRMFRIEEEAEASQHHASTPAPEKQQQYCSAAKTAPAKTVQQQMVSEGGELFPVLVRGEKCYTPKTGCSESKSSCSGHGEERGPRRVCFRLIFPQVWALLALSREGASFFPKNFPERVAKICVFPVPLIGCLFFGAIKPFLGVSIRDKVSLERGDLSWIGAPIPESCQVLGAEVLEAVETTRRRLEVVSDDDFLEEFLDAVEEAELSSTKSSGSGSSTKSSMVEAVEISRTQKMLRRVFGAWARAVEADGRAGRHNRSSGGTVHNDNRRFRAVEVGSSAGQK